MRHIRSEKCNLYQFSSYIFHLLFIFTLLTGFALADEVQLRNGDRLTGNVIRSDGKTLTIRTEYAGDISVSLSAVEKVSAEKLFYVELSNGSIIIGRITHLPKDSGALTVESADFGEKLVELASIRAIRSDNEHMEYLRQAIPEWTDLWDGGMNMGFTLTTGNTKTRSLALGGNLGRETHKDKTSLYATYAKSTRIRNDDDETTAYTTRGGWRYQYTLAKGVYAFAFTDLEQNDIQYLNLRAVPGTGFGYYVTKNRFLEVEAFGGASFNHEDYFCQSGDYKNTDPRCLSAQKIIRNSAEGLAGQSLTLKLNNNISFKERMQFFPNISDKNVYRATYDSTLTVKFMKWLSWNVTASDRYISNPPADSKNNDLLLTTGLGFTFNDFNFKR